MRSLIKYLCLTAAMVLGAARYCSAQQVAVKTNALTFAMGMPNIGMELVTSDKTSLDLSASGAYYPYAFDMKLAGAQAEFRFWLAGRPMVREFIGISLMASTYDIAWRGTDSYKGDAAGIGVSLGYVLPITARWNVEFRAGFSGLYFRQIQHKSADNPNDYVQGTSDVINATGIKFLPTLVGVSFSYIIK